ncbi:MAG: HEPN domain-containing protein [Polaromonas sp.]|uniref:HEPN domain-containing protein n=1 Tax=Polaromonas sp. TaxID=1869339 RepID=UPI002736467F|nr:HEPN domain-containing protein [Polaromonas sp.]MDP3799743.1 HEPN domain-containing protein [Polaromonas sp.]
MIKEMSPDLHEQAVLRIQKHIDGTLQKCMIHDTWPSFESYSDHAQALATEVLKHKKKWVSIIDIYFMFIEHVYRAIKPIKPDDGQLEGPLKAILGEGGISQLSAQLLKYIQGIPRKYQVYVPLPPLAPLEDTLEIAEGFRLLRVVSRKAFPGEFPPSGLFSLSDDEIKPAQYFLMFETQGYCGDSIAGSAARQALSTFKISMQQALARGLFQKRKDTAAGLGLIFSTAYGSFTVPKHYLVLEDMEPGAAPTRSLELSIEICRLLDSHSFAKDNGQVSITVDAGTVDKLIAAYLKAAAQLHATQKPEAARIKSAIEWAFDAYVNENPTMSFLQTCIALEAVYGDDNDGENVTKTLADRCAYLIGTNIKGRKTIRDNFRSLYSIRSKIVHGSAASLASEEEYFLDWGKTALEISITKEIKNLALEKT